MGAMSVCTYNFCSSPYICIRSQAWIEEIILGDRFCPKNPFGWDIFVLNLPGSKDYDPKNPWVYKWNTKSGAIAGDATPFVDNGRLTGRSKEHYFIVTRSFSYRVNYYGSQDACRKRRPPSQSDNGPWNGSITITDNKNIYVMTIQAK